MTARLVSSIEIVRIAKSAGFDSLYIDLEHSSFSMETTSQICVMALEAGIPALVRVPANTPEYISRVLDGGALGVIAPGVRSAGAARAVGQPAAAAVPHFSRGGDPARAQRRDAGDRAVRVEGGARGDGRDRRGRRRRPGADRDQRPNGGPRHSRAVRPSQGARRL